MDELSGISGWNGDFVEFPPDRKFLLRVFGIVEVRTPAIAILCSRGWLVGFHDMDKK